MDVELSRHAREVLKERGLDPGWVARTLLSPEATEEHPDGTVHFLARLPEREGRVLRVVTAAGSSPPSVVTAFLDRRMKGRLP